MKYNRFKRIPSPFKPNTMAEYEYSESYDELRIVDDKYYVPNKQALEILARNSAAQVLDNLLYDSEEDLRNGSVNVYARQKKRDLAELTQQSRRLQAQAEKGIKDAIAAKQAQQAQQAQQVQQTSE